MTHPGDQAARTASGQPAPSARPGREGPYRFGPRGAAGRGPGAVAGKDRGRRRAVGVARLACTLLLLVAGPRPAVSRGTFVMGLPAEPVYLDPAVATDGASLLVAHQLFETLVRLRPGTTEIEPGLAERWTVSPDGTVWTFDLRRGVRFHDGSPLDAAAVVWNFDRWRRRDHPHHRDQLAAGRTFEYWESQFGGFDDASVVRRVEAIGPGTVRLTLGEPLAPLLASLATPGLGIASPRAVARWGPAFGQHPAGSGPFRLAEWRPREAVVLDASPAYWGPAPRVARVVVRPVRNAAQRLAALRAGELHALEGLDPDLLGAVARDPGLVLLRRPAYATAYLAFNFRVREFQDRRIRQAVAQAVDKAALVQGLFGGLGRVATQFQPPVLWGHDPALADHPHDPSVARALLREAGIAGELDTVTWEDGTREPLVLWYPPVARPYLPSPRETVEAVAAYLGRVGIRAAPRTMDWAGYLDRVQRGRLALFLLGWIGDTGDPDHCLCYVFCQPGAPQQGYYAHERLVSLLRRARALPDRQARAALYRAAERILRDDVARVFLAHVETPLVLSRRVTGYVPSPTGAESWATIELR